MHSLETIVRLNDQAAERELARDYGRAHVQSTADLVGPGPRMTEERARAHAGRIVALRARLLAVLAALVASCGPDSGPADPELAGPCPGPSITLRAAILVLDADTGRVIGIGYR